MPARSSRRFANSLTGTPLRLALVHHSWRCIAVSKSLSAIFTITFTWKTTFSFRAQSKWNRRTDPESRTRRDQRINLLHAAQETGKTRSAGAFPNSTARASVRVSAAELVDRGPIL